MIRVLWFILFILVDVFYCHNRQMAVKKEEIDCPYFDTFRKNNELDSIDLAQIAGKWWELETYDNHKIMEPHSCLVSNFYYTTPAVFDPRLGQISPIAQVTVLDDLTFFEKKHKMPHTKIRWSLKMDGIKFMGKMKAKKITKIKEETYSFDIIGTDYTSFLVAYTCRREAYSHKDSLKGGIVLSRNQTLSTEEIADIDRKVDNLLKIAGISRSFVAFRNNSLCDNVTFPAEPPFVIFS